MASIRDIADLSDSMRFKNFMDLVRPGLRLSGFFFFWFHSFSKNLEHGVGQNHFLQIPGPSCKLRILKNNRVSNPLQEMNYLNPGDNTWEKWNLNVDDTNFELAGAPERT